ncbi:hypothetical protein DL96DRAFT_1821266 [Flagelloscypha sp. PMI_526]|nr:hypothetical protein DL96DRAFT_1821266 [Flagelloscypha sp. PMI_526]
MENSENANEDCISAVYLGRCAVELPAELVEGILGLATLNAPADQRLQLSTLSKYTYNSLFPYVYGAIHLPPIGSRNSGASDESFTSFLAWVDSQPQLLQQKIKALRLSLDKSGDDEQVWTRLFCNLSSLKILDIYCFDWNHKCRVSVWDLIFKHPKLTNLRLDWHFNAMTIPTQPEDVFPALRSVTHLSVVPDYRTNFGLKVLSRFKVLSHLAVFNPAAGYTQQDIINLDAGLPNLHMLVLIVEVEEMSEWEFDNNERIVALPELAAPIEDEFQSLVQGGSTIWKKGQDSIARNLGIPTF